MNELFFNRLNRPCCCNLIIIDNFYDNPIDVRNFALKQKYLKVEKIPGLRTEGFATRDHYNKLQKIMSHLGGKIHFFDIEKKTSNGSFHYTTTKDNGLGWKHIDNDVPNNDNKDNNKKISKWAAIVYLTPNAPLSAGTGLFEFIDSTKDEEDTVFLKNGTELKKHSYDKTKWRVTDRIANIFNRLVIYKSTNYHSALDYFGTNINDGRLSQIFFFTTDTTMSF